MAGRIAEFYEAKLQRSLDRIVGIVGPLAIISISAVVGGLIVSVMPFLFVDQLAVQIPASLAESRDGKLRILLAVSGQWQDAKRAQDDKSAR